MMLVLGRFLFFLFSFRFTLFLLFRFVAVFFIPIHVFTNCLCTLYQCNLRISATNIKENRHTIKIKERIVTPERTDARFIYAAWNDFPRKNNYLFVCCFTIAAQSLCLFVEVWWLIGIEFAYDRTFSVFFFCFLFSSRSLIHCWLHFTVWTTFFPFATLRSWCCFSFSFFSLGLDFVQRARSHFILPVYFASSPSPSTSSSPFARLNVIKWLVLFFFVFISTRFAYLSRRLRVRTSLLCLLKMSLSFVSM